MQIQVYEDADCTQPAFGFEAPYIGAVADASYPAQHTTGTFDRDGNTITYHTGTIRSDKFAGMQDGLVCTPASEYGKDSSAQYGQPFYIKPDIELRLTCYNEPHNDSFRTRTSMAMQVPPESLKHPTVFPSNPDNISKNFYACTFTLNGEILLGIYIYDPRYSSNNALWGMFFTASVFDESPRLPTKSETGTVTPNGHYGVGKTTKGDMVFVNYAGALSRVNTGTHGLRMYDVGEGAVNALYGRLWSQDIWDKWANRKFSPIGGILSLHRVPLAAPTAGTVSSVTIAGQQYPVGSAALVSDNIVTRDFAEVLIPEIAGSFLDYAPYCSAMLYLPFIGSVGIDVNTISSGSIAVRYTFDLISGNCIAQVRTVDRDGSAIIYGTYAGNAAYKYPISGNDNGGFAVLGAAAGIATAGLAVAATGGSAAPLAASIVSGAAASISAEHHLQQAGSLPANTAALGDLRIYLVITRPAYLTPDDYESIKGYPAGDGHTVGSYSGLLSGELHAESIVGATDSEKQEIESAFRGGVFV